MKKNLKNSFLFIIISIVLYLALEQFLANSIIIYITVIFLALLLLFLLRNITRRMSFSQLIIIFLFLTIISIPLVGKKETVSLENRKLSDFPEMRIENIWAFFFDFNKYFTDRFSFRNNAVSTISKFKYKKLNVSPTPNLVTIGYDNWLFYSPEHVIKDMCTPFTKDQLDLIKMNLRITTKWFDSHNIKYYLVILPFKARIYPEMMPIQLKQHMNFANYLQLYNYIKNDTSIRFIDCTQELINGKNTRPTYYKTDTHWNEYGAFLGYRKIIERVKQDFPILKPLEINDFIIDSCAMNYGDLEFLMGFTKIISDIEYKLKFRQNDVLSVNSKMGYNKRVKQKNANRLKLFMIRDSFTEYLMALFSENFYKSEFYWSPIIPAKQIVDVKPNVVIHEMLELFILNVLELPKDIKSDTAFLNKNFPEYQLKRF